MPPFLPRKRHHSPASELPQTKPVKRARLADALDAEATNNVPGLAKAKTFSLGSDSESSLSEVDSDEFEDVPIKDKKSQVKKARVDDEDDEEIEWEDTAVVDTNGPTDGTPAHVPMADGPIQLTFRKDDEEFDYSTARAAAGQKKGPTRREKHVRILTHQLHVQFLMFHNAVRNSWIGDKTVQQTLVNQLPSQITKEVVKWKRASGLLPPEPAPEPTPQKGKKRRKNKVSDERNQRDWGQPSQRLEPGKPDMSRGDPLIALLKVLSQYWKKRFAITQPGLRKRGYGTKQGLKQEINSFRNEEHDPEKHGERIQNLDEFRKIAEVCEGSRDVGAQLFTSLLRGLGIEARMVASLQPCGYGWTKVEQMVPKKLAKSTTEQDTMEMDSSDEEDVKPASKGKQLSKSLKPKSAPQARPQKAKSEVINLDSSADDDIVSIKDDESIVDVTPLMPQQRKPRYDRDMAFPIYWTEAISPITNIVLPVSPLVLETPVATTPEILAMFEPRGAKAEKARQVMAYVVAHSSDGTAKDVTVRYLRKRLWPGKAKAFRLPVEKVPVYDTRGKIKRHEDYDWFKRVMASYGRSHSKRAAVDDLEDTTDLVPQEPEKKDDDGVDTLQSLKASADYVLEKFLRREEALRPEAKPVRTFASGKGDKYKEENVYRRADVERCLTAESWHKEGRRPKFGESAMKFVPVRAVTLTRKREAEEHERQTGEKQTQGLYAWDQTEYIIPDPIEDGVIPKNAYGNMDCFVPTMVPRGAVHIPLKGTVRICKKLEIDFAEAVTGFEFGNKRAVPVCTGVVVAEENEKLVKDAWQVWNVEQRRKEETKMEALVLGLWRKFVMGLRIRERIADVYGDELGIDPTPTGLHENDPITLDDDEGSAQDVAGGGFVADEDEDMGGGFLMPHEDDVSEAEELVMDSHVEAANEGHQKLKAQFSSPPLPATHGVKSGKRSLAVSAEGTPDITDGTEDSEVQSEAEPMDFTKLKSNRSQHASSGGASKYANARTTGKTNAGPNGVDSTDSSTNGGAGIESDSSDGKSQPEHPGVSKKSSRSPTNTSQNDSKDEESEDDHAEYNPRPTRTRRANIIAQPPPKPATRPVKFAKSQKATPKSRTMTAVETNGNGRKRGRPRKSDMDVTPADTPKRSSRLLRKESTRITSPYFEDED